MLLRCKETKGIQACVTKPYTYNKYTFSMKIYGFYRRLVGHATDHILKPGLHMVLTIMEHACDGAPKEI